MKVFLFRKVSIAAALLAFASFMHAAPESEAAPATDSAAPAMVAGEVAAAPPTDMTIPAESENAADATVLAESKPVEKRAKLLERRRQSEEQMLNLLREVGGDVPQLRESLRGYLQEEARARRPIRDVGRRLLSALRVGISTEKTTSSTESIQKLRDTFGLETPAAADARHTLGGVEEVAPETANTTNLDAEMRVSLRQQKTAANALAENAFGATSFGMVTPGAIAPDSDARVLASQDDEELRALVATMRQMQAAERERRLAREAELDAKLHFRDNPRLEAALLLLGIIGDSGYTISIKALPNARAATPPQDTASTREVQKTKEEETISEKAS